MAQRECERCHRKMAPYVARWPDPKTGEKLCEGCKNGREGRPLTGSWVVAQASSVPVAVRTALMEKVGVEAMRFLAHDSGDGVTIYHCPFCGSGQVVARSDGTTECEFCHNSFLVQIQPQQHAMPQTINGVPYQIPGMPERAQKPDEAPGDEGDDDKSFGGDDLSEKVDDPKEAPADDDKNPFAKDSAPKDDKAKDDSAPPKESMLITESGFALPLDQYITHLALKTSDDKEATLDEVRRSREV